MISSILRSGFWFPPKAHSAQIWLPSISKTVQFLTEKSKKLVFWEDHFFIDFITNSVILGFNLHLHPYNDQNLFFSTKQHTIVCCLLPTFPPLYFNRFLLTAHIAKALCSLLTVTCRYVSCVFLIWQVKGKN